MLLYGIGWNRFSGWNSFMEIILRRLDWKPCSVLHLRASSPCQREQLVIFSISRSFAICFNTFLLQTLWPALKNGKLSPPPYCPMKMCVCVPPLLYFSILISPREKWNLQQWSCGVIILYCLILQVLWFNYLSIYIPSIDLCRERIDRVHQSE